MPIIDTYHLKTLSGQSSVRKRNFNLPNCLTVSRILLIPVFVLLFASPDEGRAVASAMVFGLAALTDLLDGYVARRRKQITNLGKLLDPVADKLLIVSALVLLVQFQRVATWVVIVMIAREIVVTGLRAVAAREGLIVSADPMGKWKVVFQVIAILFLILQNTSFDRFSLSILNFHVVGTFLLYLALGLALFSGWRYIVVIWGKIRLSS